jgi:hypothetical protein
MNPKLTPERLSRKAIVYVRQSKPSQLIHNQESTRLQLSLADRARALGFQRIVVVDEDLGRTGSGLVDRPGFQRLVAEVCSGEVGAVFCVEASRLARNGRDWHHLIDLCGMVGAVVVDLAKMLSCEMSFRLVTAIDNRNVRLNVSCQEPSQKLSTSIGLIGYQILWVNPELTGMLNHTPCGECLLTEQGRRRMDRQNDSARGVDQIVVVVAQPGLRGCLVSHPKALFIKESPSSGIFDTAFTSSVTRT